MKGIYRLLMTLTVVCVSGSPYFAKNAATTNTAKVTPSATVAASRAAEPFSDPSDLMKSVRVKYSKLKHYSADGESITGVSTASYPGEVTTKSVKSHFVFDRQGLFTLNWAEPQWLQDTKDEHKIVYDLAADKMVELNVLYPQSVKGLGFGSLLYVVDAGSGGNFFIPRLLVNEKIIIEEMPVSTTKVELSDEVVEGVECSKLKWNHNEPNLHWETDLWVRKSDLMIVKFRREMRFDDSVLIEENLQKNIQSD